MSQCRESFCLKIGEFSTQLLIDRKYITSLQERYAGFISENPAGMVLKCDEDPTVRNPEYADQAQSVLQSLNLQIDDTLPEHVLEILWPQAQILGHKLLIWDQITFRIEFDMQSQRGSLRLCPEDPGYPLSMNFLHGALKNLYAAISILSGQAFLMHSSAVDLEDNGILFFGRSGAGKTTICTMFGKDNILNDEINLIHKRKNDVYIYSTPFLGSLRMPTRHRRVKLKRAFSLNQASTAATQILKREKIFFLAMQCITVAKNSLLAKKAFDNLVEIVEPEKWQKIHFKKDKAETTKFIRNIV